MTCKELKVNDYLVTLPFLKASSGALTILFSDFTKLFSLDCFSAAASSASSDWNKSKG
jgi:hypothetical protein